jgi:Fusaric acid resistance protein-like
VRGLRSQGSAPTWTAAGTISSIRDFASTQFTLKRFLGALIVASPFLIAYMATSDRNFISVCFIALCLYVPAARTRVGPVTTIVSFLLTIAALIVFVAASASTLLFAVSVAVAALLVVAFELIDPVLRTVGNFIFVPAIFLTCHLVQGDDASLTQNLVAILKLSPLALAVGLLYSTYKMTGSDPSAPPLRESTGRSTKRRHYSAENLAPLIAAPVAVFGTTFANFDIGVPSAQWVIWSSLVVIMGDPAAAYEKARSRTIGVLVGVPAGIAMAALLPVGETIEALLAVGVLLTLTIFKSYVIEYGTRSAFVAAAVITAGNSGILVDARVVDVFAGCLFGVLVLRTVYAVLKRLVR